MVTNFPYTRPEVPGRKLFSQCLISLRVGKVVRNQQEGRERNRTCEKT